MTTPLYSHAMSVPFQDIDAAGIVFFARVFDYFHNAFVAHLRACGINMATEMVKEDSVGPLVHVEADYKSPMRFGDDVCVDILSAEVKETSFTLHYQIVSQTSPQCLFCTGKLVHVTIDRRTWKPCPVPISLRAAYRADAKGV